jgi:hypothetical protein
VWVPAGVILFWVGGRERSRLSAYHLACRGKYGQICRGLDGLIGSWAGPGPPALRLCGPELAVQGAFGVASAMGFAHPGLRPPPLARLAIGRPRPNGVRLTLYVHPYLVLHRHQYADTAR